MPRRQFINKKTATTYALVHRAQNDPLIHSSDAPQMVFAERKGPAEDFEEDYEPSLSASQSRTRSRKVKQRGDLEEEFGFSFRNNEGQAAEQGVFFDDTSYDYMQHMRDLGGREGGEVAWVPAPAEERGNAKGKGKGKQRLEDAIAGLDISQQSAPTRSFGHADAASEGGVSLTSGASRASTSSLLPSDMLPSEFVRPTTYQDQQDVPDAIAGFQPDMDPRLREVLEALDDEAYVDDEDDIFGELTGEGEEIDDYEFEGMSFDVDETAGVEAFLDSTPATDDDGWESDDTVRAGDDKSAPSPSSGLPVLPPANPNATPAADPNGGAWLSEYSKFKETLKAEKDASKGIDAIAPSESADRSALSSLATGRRKKRKGAKTSTTNYSMTSSALARTDHQSLLDDRFDKVLSTYDEEDEYAVDMGMDSLSLTSGASGVSRASRASKADSIASGLSGISGISSYSRATDSEAPQLVRSDFDSIMDGFLEGQRDRGGQSRRDAGTIGPGGRKSKRGAAGEGLRELDEIRKGLGAARVR